MKNKIIKKLLPVVLTLTMVVGMSMTAFAASSSDSNGRTVSGNDVSGNSSSSEETESVAENTSTTTATNIIVNNAGKVYLQKVQEEVAMPVTTFDSASAISAIPVEAKNTVTTDAMYNLSKVTTIKGFTSAVDKIAKANPVATSVAVFSSKPITFDKELLTAVADMNKEFVYIFNHNGHLYKVTIPAGAKVDLNGVRFAGPLYIGAQLGTSEVLD